MVYTPRKQVWVWTTDQYYIAVLECDKHDKNIRWFLSNLQQWHRTFWSLPIQHKSRLTKSIDVSSDVSKLDEEMCGPLNRTGLLCSHCQPGLGPAVFSYYKECKECTSQPLGWLLFFVRLTVPLTLVCVVVIVFRINIASPVLNLCFDCSSVKHNNV